MQGYIALHRQITENEFYFSERFTKIQAWIDLLLLGSHKSRTIFLKGTEINLKAGELCYSQVSLAKRWKWNERTVKKYLNLLQIRKMIQTKTNNVTTIITILNWNRYQINTERNTEQNTERIQSGIQTNNNVKNVDNVNNDKIGARHTLHSPSTFVFNNCRNFFIKYTKSNINPDYIFDGKEGKNLKDLLRKLGTSMKSRKPDFNDTDIQEAFNYMVSNINNKWLLEHFTLSKINSQYNEILQSLSKQDVNIKSAYNKLTANLQ